MHYSQIATVLAGLAAVPALASPVKLNPRDPLLIPDNLEAFNHLPGHHPHSPKGPSSIPPAIPEWLSKHANLPKGEDAEDEAGEHIPEEVLALAEANGFAMPNGTFDRVTESRLPVFAAHSSPGFPFISFGAYDDCARARSLRLQNTAHCIFTPLVRDSGIIPWVMIRINPTGQNPHGWCKGILDNVKGCKGTKVMKGHDDGLAWCNTHYNQTVLPDSAGDIIEGIELAIKLKKWEAHDMSTTCITDAIRRASCGVNLQFLNGMCYVAHPTALPKIENGFVPEKAQDTPLEKQSKKEE